MLSIIIPTLNEEKYLPLLLDSIKKQDYADYEVIVADAGSEDKTVAIAKKYGYRVVAGGLLPVGRNRGAEVARGDTLLFLDADVILPAHFLENALARFEKNNLGIAGFTILPINGKIIDKVAFNFLNILSLLTQKILPYSAVAILCKKSVHEAIGRFDEKIVFIEDYPYAKAASKVAKYKFIKDLSFYSSVRRFEKDGRLKVYIKYILGHLYMLFWGPIRSDIFKYKFGHYEEKTGRH